MMDCRLSEGGRGGGGGYDRSLHLSVCVSVIGWVRAQREAESRAESLVVAPALSSVQLRPSCRKDPAMIIR